jgi:hypothetical protein
LFGPSAAACLQMIIVSELIIKLDEQPLSSAAAATAHIYTHALVSRANIRARNIIRGGSDRKRAGETALLFAFLSCRRRATLFAECSAVAFHDTPIYFHRAGVTQKGIS